MFGKISVCFKVFLILFFMSPAFLHPSHFHKELLAPRSNFSLGKIPAGLSIVSEEYLGPVETLPAFEEQDYSARLLQEMGDLTRDSVLKRLKEKIALLKEVQLNPDKAPDEEYLEAGWFAIDWDRLEQQIILALYQLQEQINDGIFTIHFVDQGDDIGFYSPFETKPTLPVYSFLRNGTDIFITTALARSEDGYLRDEILFYTLLKDSIQAILEKEEVPDPERLSRPITTALENIITPKRINSSTTSLVQQRNLILAAKLGLKDYLKSLEQDHPLDFNGNFGKEVSKALKVSEILGTRDFYRTDLKKHVKNYLAGLNEPERLQIIVAVFKDSDLDPDFWLSLLEPADLETLNTIYELEDNIALKDYFSSLIKERVRPLLVEFLGEGAVVISENDVKQISKTGLSTCYSQNDAVLIKTANSPEDIKFFILEKNIFEYIESLDEHPGYFPGFIDGFLIVKIGNRYELALLTEYIPGSVNLREFVSENGTIPFEQTLSLFWQLLEAVSFLHEHNVIIRDIKPENILIKKQPDGTLKLYLIDFGLSHKFGERPFEEGQLTGTPYFFTPEEIRQDIEDYSAKQDLFKIGLVFYYMVSKGHLPFFDFLIHEENVNTPNVFEILTLIVSKDPKDLYAYDPAAAQNLNKIMLFEIIMKMISGREPNNRYYQNSDEVMYDFAFLLNQVFPDNTWMSFVSPKYYDMVLERAEFSNYSDVPLSIQTAI